MGHTLVESYCTREKFNEWKENKIDTSQRWLELFDHFEVQNLNCSNIKIMVKFSMALAGTNASVERIFSLMDDYWGDEKSRLSVETLSSVLIVKTNINLKCDEFKKTLEENQDLLKKIHSSNKYL